MLVTVRFFCVGWVFFWMRHPIRCLTLKSCSKTQPTAAPLRAFKCAMSTPNWSKTRQSFDGSKSDDSFRFSHLQQRSSIEVTHINVDFYSRCCRRLFSCFKKRDDGERVVPIGRPCPEKYIANVFNNQRYNIVTFIPMVIPSHGPKHTQNMKY